MAKRRKVGGAAAGDDDDDAGEAASGESEDDDDTPQPWMSDAQLLGPGMNAVFGEENINATQRALDARELSMAENGGAAINDVHVFATEETEPGIGPGVLKYLIPVDDDINNTALTVPMLGSILETNDPKGGWAMKQAIMRLRKHKYLPCLPPPPVPKAKRAPRKNSKKAPAAAAAAPKAKRTHKKAAPVAADS